MFSYTKFFAQPPNYNLDKHGVVVLFFNLLKSRAGQIGPNRPKPASPRRQKGKRAGWTGFHGLRVETDGLCWFTVDGFGLGNWHPRYPKPDRWQSIYITCDACQLYSSDKSHPMKIAQKVTLDPQNKTHGKAIFSLLLHFPKQFCLLSSHQSSYFTPFLSLSRAFFFFFFSSRSIHNPHFFLFTFISFICI